MKRKDKADIEEPQGGNSPKSGESDRNNGSIVMKIIYGDTSFLFTGDAEREE